MVLIGRKLHAAPFWLVDLGKLICAYRSRVGALCESGTQTRLAHGAGLNGLWPLRPWTTALRALLVSMKQGRGPEHPMSGRWVKGAKRPRLAGAARSAARTRDRRGEPLTHLERPTLPAERHAASVPEGIKK